MERRVAPFAFWWSCGHLVLLLCPKFAQLECFKFTECGGAATEFQLLGYLLPGVVLSPQTADPFEICFICLRESLQI